MIPAEALPVGEPTFETNLLNLLIVEDERSVPGNAAREVARYLGFSVQVAESREEAYRILQHAAPDVRILDLRLSGSNGLEVLREIKRRREEAVVIVMTGFATVQSAVQAGIWGRTTTSPSPLISTNCGWSWSELSHI